MPFCRKWKMILQSVPNIFKKSRMSLNAARESSRRISTKFIASEAITEKQHYQSASQLSTIEWQRCMLACSYSTTSARIQLFYIIW